MYCTGTSTEEVGHASSLVRGRSIVAIVRLYRPYDEPRLLYPVQPTDSAFSAFSWLFSPKESLYIHSLHNVRSTSLLKL